MFKITFFSVLTARHGSTGNPSSIHVPSQHLEDNNQYVSPSSAHHFQPLSHSAALATGPTSQPFPVPSTVDSLMEQPRPNGSVMVQPISTLKRTDHFAMPTQSFHPSSVLAEPEISGTNNQVVNEPIHGPLTYHTSKVLEISPSLGGVSIAPPSQGVSNFATNPNTQTHSFPFTADPTSQQLLSTRSQIFQPSENVSSLKGGKQIVSPEISLPGMSLGHQTFGGQPVNYKVQTSPQVITTEYVPSNIQQGSLVDAALQPVLITRSNEAGTRQFNSISAHSQEPQSEVRGFQPVMGTSSAPVQNQSSSRPFLEDQILQRSSLNQEPQSVSYEPHVGQISSGHSMGKNFQGPILSQTSPYRKSVAFQQPLVSYRPSTQHNSTNQISTASQSTLAPDPSANVIPSLRSSKTYPPQVLQNKHPLNFGQITPGTQTFSNQQYAPPMSQPESVNLGYPVVPGSPVASSSPIDSPSSPVWTHRSHLGEQFSPISK